MYINIVNLSQLLTLYKQDWSGSRQRQYAYLFLVTNKHSDSLSTLQFHSIKVEFANGMWMKSPKFYKDIWLKYDITKLTAVE